MSTEITTIEAAAQQEAVSLADTARALVVNTVGEAEKASEVLSLVVDSRKRIEDWFKPLVDSAHRAHKALTTRRSEILAKFAEPELLIRGKLSAYQREQDRIRREAEAAAAAAARKAAEEAQLQQALAAEQSGDAEQAERILDAEPVPIVQPVELPEPAKLSGVSFVPVWKFEVTDFVALPNEYKAVDSAKLGKVVKALGSATNIPGVRVWPEQSVRVK